MGTFANLSPECLRFYGAFFGPFLEKKLNSPLVGVAVTRGESVVDEDVSNDQNAEFSKSPVMIMWRYGL